MPQPLDRVLLPLDLAGKGLRRIILEIPNPFAQDNLRESKTQIVRSEALHHTPASAESGAARPGPL